MQKCPNSRASACERRPQTETPGLTMSWGLHQPWDGYHCHHHPHHRCHRVPPHVFCSLPVLSHFIYSQCLKMCNLLEMNGFSLTVSYVEHEKNHSIAFWSLERRILVALFSLWWKWQSPACLVWNGGTDPEVLSCLCAENLTVTAETLALKNIIQLKALFSWTLAINTTSLS